MAAHAHREVRRARAAALTLTQEVLDDAILQRMERDDGEPSAVRAVVVTSGKDKIFCAGANIRMLAGSSHPWKVNFCKFTNETRNGMEDMTEAGQTWIAALNGTAAGGGRRPVRFASRSAPRRSGGRS